MKLHLMTDKGLQSKKGAVCLDGTDAGFYFAPAADPAFATSWQLYFEGGGWCYDEIDCYQRSLSRLGSTSARPGTVAGGGLISDDCKVNPDFCNFNRVYMVYCDGNSFSGNRDEPLLVRGLDGKERSLYFRGKRIIDAVLETLLTSSTTKFGLGQAETVMLTGCSAGGLATFLHTDYVHAWLKQAGLPLKKFGSVPISGAFLLHSTVEGKPVYPTEMQTIFHLANSTHGLNDRCVASLGEAERWRCNFAEVSYAYTESPIFPLNSALDAWSTACILTAELPPNYPNQTIADNGLCAAVPGWAACSASLEACTGAEVSALNHWVDDFQHAFKNTTTFSKPGNGAFLHSCHTHCEAQDDHLFKTFAVGGVTMQQAISKWWRSDFSEPAEQHSYTPCHLHAEEGKTRRCNPTCAPHAAANSVESGSAPSSPSNLRALVV